MTISEGVTTTETGEDKQQRQSEQADTEKSKMADRAPTKQVRWMDSVRKRRLHGKIPPFYQLLSVLCRFPRSRLTPPSERPPNQRRRKLGCSDEILASLQRPFY